MIGTIMRKRIDKKMLGVLALLVPLLVLFLVVVLRSGPMSPVEVTVVRVEERAIQPVLKGIGVVEARAVHKIGPTAAGRVAVVAHEVGDMVKKGDVLCAIDPVDLDERLSALEQRVEEAARGISKAEAHVREARVKLEFAGSQEQRYTGLYKVGAASLETLEQKRQDASSAKAAEAAAVASLAAGRHHHEALMAEYRAVAMQRKHLLLTAPVDGLLVSREVDKGNSVVAGQTLLELVSPDEVWLEARFDQHQATGLVSGLDSVIQLRSRPDDPLAGKVSRIEPLADPVTEEMMAKIAFQVIPATLPPLGELAEISVALPTLYPAPVVPSAGIRRVDGRTGVWVTRGKRVEFREIRTGRTGEDGYVQVLEGVDEGEEVVVYSMKSLDPHSRISRKEVLVKEWGT